MTLSQARSRVHRASSQLSSPPALTRHTVGHRFYDTRNTFSNPDLVVIVTDGNPNTVRGGSGGGASESQAVQAAMVEANLIKAGGAHMLAIGVASVDEANLGAITNGAASIVSPTTPVNGSTIKTLDIIKSTFGDLEDAMKALASALCDGSVKVEKLVDGDPAPGWEFTATDKEQRLHEREW